MALDAAKATTSEKWDRRWKTLGGALDLGRPLAAPREAVHPEPLVERLLRARDVFLLARPAPHHRILQGARIRERQHPRRVRVEKIHRVQVRGRFLGALPARKEIDRR